MSDIDTEGTAPPSTQPGPAHLLAAVGGDVLGTRFLAQRLDDGHLGKVLHGLLELGQGPPAIAFAAFDVLGLRFWGGVCEIQEQSASVTGFLQIWLLGHSTQDWFGCSISSTESPPPFQEHCPHHGVRPGGLELVLLHKTQSKLSQGRIGATSSSPFPH